MDKISVIVPIYNMERYLRQCLDSIVDQTCQDLDIILVDDGSPDSCGTICDEYASRDRRITVIHKGNEGVSAARNDGIEAAAGEWIMFVDPDDWLEPDCCSQVLSAVGQAQYDVVYFQHEEHNDSGDSVRRLPRIGSFELSRNDLQKVQLDALADYLESFGFVSAVPWGKLYRRKFLLDNGCRFPIGVKKRQDVIFNLYCLDYLDRAYFYDYVGYHYRQNENSVCRKYNPEILTILVSALCQADKFVRERHGDESAYERMLGAQTYNILWDLENILLFHPEHIMTFREYKKHMRLYFDDPVVKKYRNKCRLSDMRTLKKRVRFILLSRNHLFLYYCMRYLKAKLTR